VARVVTRIKALGHWLLTPGETLYHRVVHAGFWVFSLRIADRLFGLARTIILARLLSPEDFGLFGIATLALSALEAFSQIGFQAALVQKKGDVKPYLDTAWTVQILRGFALAGILTASAPVVAGFFGEPRAAMLLRVLALSELAKGFTNIGVLFFQKELEFHKRFVYMLSGTLADFGVAVTAAVLMRNAWALAFGLLARSAAQVLTSYILHQYRPRPRLDASLAREMYGFGRWIMATNIVVFLITNGDNAVVGKVLGASALGLYQMAFLFSNLMATEITHVLSQVTFPAYSALQDNVASLKRAFLQTLEVTMALSLPLSVGIVMFAPEFVRLFLGEAWTPMVPALQILAVSGLIRSVVAIGGSLFKGVGRPELDFWMNAARLGAMALLIYPLTKRYGLEGTAIAVVFGGFVALPIWWITSQSITRAGYRAFLWSFLPSAVGTAATSVAIVLGKTLLGATTLINFILIAAIGVVACTGVYLVFWIGCRTGPFRVLGLYEHRGHK
jgi:O-antigen/teichoic acid export membrane protein